MTANKTKDRREYMRRYRQENRERVRTFSRKTRKNCSAYDDR